VNYDRAKLVTRLIGDEDLRLKVYRCTEDKLSCGVGRNLDDVGIRPAEKQALGLTVASIIKNGLTRSQALALLDNDIDAAEADLDRALPWWRSLSDVRQRVLLNMCFNMGIGRVASPGKKAKGLLSFVNTLTFMRTGNFVAAAKGMRASQWADQVHARAERLARMMETGKDVA
jgi:lysozyme